jgi:hypothetical protein
MQNKLECSMKKKTTVKLFLPFVTGNKISSAS